MNKVNSWIKRNPLITILLCVAIVLPLFGLISVQTNGFNNPEELLTRDTNPDNLLNPGEDGNYVIESNRTEEGLSFTVNDNGSIKLSGTNKNAVTADKQVVAKLSLEKGTYTISSGYSNPSKYTVWMEVSYGDTVINDCSGATPGQFTLTDTTEVTVTLFVYPTATWNTTVYPVLVAGEKAGSFWA